MAKGGGIMILLDIGNTHTRIAESRGAAVTILRTVPTAELAADMIPAVEIAAASVAPWAAERLKTLRIDYVNAANCRYPIDFSLVDAVTLGADRVANAVAAAEYYPLPALVVDCGSAITFELVDARRRFLGGAILPGRALMRKALNTGTAQLPEVPLAGAVPEHPGRNTAEAIRLGVDGGALGMVREVCRRLSSGLELGSVVLTGGDAGFFAPHFPDWSVAAPEFTLQGIRLASGG